jgi:hypothetical protein
MALAGSFAKSLANGDLMQRVFGDFFEILLSANREVVAVLVLFHEQIVRVVLAHRHRTASLLIQFVRLGISL